MKKKKWFEQLEQQTMNTCSILYTCSNEYLQNNQRSREQLRQRERERKTRNEEKKHKNNNELSKQSKHTIVVARASANI